MCRVRLMVLYALALCATPTFAQSSNLAPVHVAAGTLLTFYLQTRLNPTAPSALDALPKGTVLRVRLLDSVDSSVDRDGAPFRAVLVAPVTSADNEVVVHADAEVRGLFVLLRSRNHPDGFRYDLLITNVTENGKSFDLTASLSPSFSDGQKPAAATNSAPVENVPKVETSISSKPAAALHK